MRTPPSLLRHGALLLCFAAALLAACGDTAQRRPDPRPVVRAPGGEVKPSPLDAGPPLPAGLTGNPCQNPDWSRQPPGAPKPAKK